METAVAAPVSGRPCGPTSTKLGRVISVATGPFRLTFELLQVVKHQELRSLAKANEHVTQKLAVFVAVVFALLDKRRIPPK